SGATILRSETPAAIYYLVGPSFRLVRYTCFQIYICLYHRCFVLRRNPTIRTKGLERQSWCLGSSSSLSLMSPPSVSLLSEQAIKRLLCVRLSSYSILYAFISAAYVDKLPSCNFRCPFYSTFFTES